MTEKFLFIALYSAIFSINASSYHSTQKLLLYLQTNIASVEFVKKQVEAGANINADSGIYVKNLKPLHYAAFYGKKDIAAYLIDQGAKLNPKASSGQTPLYMALRKKNVALALLLIEKGADVTTDDYLGLAIYFNLIDLIVPIIKRGVDINLKNGFDETMPLHEAVLYERMEIARILLSLGADVNAKDSRGDTPLHIAADLNNVAMARLLLEWQKGKPYNTRRKTTSTN